MLKETVRLKPAIATGLLGTTNIITTANTSPSSDPLHSNINHTHSLTPTEAPSATVFTKAPLPNAPNQPTPQQSTMPSQQPSSPSSPKYPKLSLTLLHPNSPLTRRILTFFFKDSSHAIDTNT